MVGHVFRAEIRRQSTMPFDHDCDKTVSFDELLFFVVKIYFFLF